MRTKFDGISDDEIEQAVALVKIEDRYPEQESDIRRIAWLAWWMHYMVSWHGWPVTYFEGEGLNYDGHHRVRAVKFIARRLKKQILIPVRYSCDLPT